MNNNIYPTSASLHFVAFNFTSSGRNGDILKGLRYTKTDLPGIWNLGFGDIDVSTGEINDLITSDNGDSEKVLATVACTCLEFSKHYPEAIILAVGSTQTRTRLYQMGINRYFSEVNELFLLWGLFDGQWCTFEKENNYIALLAKRKRTYESNP